MLQEMFNLRDKIREALPMNRSARAQEMIRNHTLWAVGGGFIPVPAVDVAAVTALQMNLLEQLSQLYDVPFSKKPSRTLITALAGATFTYLAASALKLIPGLGTAAGGVAMATTAGATTYGIGQVAVAQFERGGTLEDINWDWAKREYQQQYERGQRVASELREEQDIPVHGATNGPSTGESTSDDVFAALDRLGELEAKGVITAEEFAAQKAKLLSRL